MLLSEQARFLVSSRVITDRTIPTDTSCFVIPACQVMLLQKQPEVPTVPRKTTGPGSMPPVAAAEGVLVSIPLQTLIDDPPPNP